jgi:hypothetical protein
MKKLLSSLALLCLLSQNTANAQNGNPWVFVLKDAQGNLTVSFKYGSPHFISNDYGPAITVIAQWSSNIVTYSQETISLKDCQRGMGKLYQYDLDGNFTGAYDYIKGGESVASGIADTLCGIAAASNQKQPVPNS